MNEPATVSKEAFDLAMAQTEQWKALLYIVTPALTTGLVVLFLRLQANTERVLVALSNNTEALKDLKEQGHGKGN